MSLALVSTLDNWPVNVFSAKAFSVEGVACWLCAGIDTRITAANAIPKKTRILLISTSTENVGHTQHRLESKKVSKVNSIAERIHRVRINPLPPTKPETADASRHILESEWNKSPLLRTHGLSCLSYCYTVVSLLSNAAQTIASLEILCVRLQRGPRHT
jgi:hypothetical protein